MDIGYRCSCYADNLPFWFIWFAVAHCLKLLIATDCSAVFVFMLWDLSGPFYVQHVQKRRVSLENSASLNSAACARAWWLPLLRPWQGAAFIGPFQHSSACTANMRWKCLGLTILLFSHFKVCTVISNHGWSVILALPSRFRDSIPLRFRSTGSATTVSVSVYCARRYRSQRYRPFLRLSPLRRFLPRISHSCSYTMLSCLLFFLGRNPIV